MKDYWVSLKLKDIVSKKGLFCDGDWVEKKDQCQNGEVRLIQLSDIGDGFFKNNSNKKVTAKWALSNNCSFLEYNDILIARMPEPLGRATLLPYKEKNKYITAVDVAILRICNKNIIDKFILYQINSPIIRVEIDKLKSGTTRKRISRRKLSEIGFNIPPLPEQRAIVSKIDQLFSELDNGIKNLEQANEKLAIYRQAVLKKAFEGELTIDYRLKNKLSNWSKNNFGSLCNFTGGGTPSKKHKNYWNGDINWASIKDIKGNYLTTTRDKISKHGLDNSSAKIAKKGELIIGTRINPGRPIITKIDTSINQDLKIARPKEKLNIKFLFYLFKQKENQILNVSNGTTVLGINLSNLNEITFEYPNSVKEQQQIVQEIEYRFSICDALEKNIKKGLQQAKNLKQSILKKAFDGKLLSQDELAVCQKEPDWEPASELLKKIKAEKEKQK